MNAIKRFFRRVVSHVKDEQAKGAQKTMLEELFNDFYIRRRNIYKMNFFRGIFFGLGSALGGTLVVALVLWILSLFVNFPFVGDLFRDAQNSINGQ